MLFVENPGIKNALMQKRDNKCVGIESSIVFKAPPAFHR